jgi:serine/threonine protein kinase
MTYTGDSINIDFDYESGYTVVPKNSSLKYLLDFETQNYSDEQNENVKLDDLLSLYPEIRLGLSKIFKSLDDPYLTNPLDLIESSEPVEILKRQEIIQRIKELALTFQMLNANEILTIIKNSQDTTNITDYEIMQIIKNIKASIGNLSQSSLDIMSSVSKVIENYDQKKWTSGKTLGEGTFGIVKIQEYDGKKVAFKEIKDNQEISDDFIHEVGSYAILTAIGSENTPKLVGFNVKNGPGFSLGIESDGTVIGGSLGIAIELADTDLYNWIKAFPDRTEPDYQEGVEKRKQLLPIIVDKLLESLAEIQSVGIMHNDIKPGNMLLTLNPDGSVAKAVITDFGGASSFPRKGPNICTSYFRAPEVWKGGMTSFASDCWSFGISIVYLCSRIHYYEEDPNTIDRPRLPTKDMTERLSKYLRPDQVELINHMVSWETRDRCVKRVITAMPARNWSLPENSVITRKMLNILFDWLHDVKIKFKMERMTLAMAFDIIFRYYNNIPINLFSINTLQLSGISALYIASLWTDYYPEVSHFVYISAETYNSQEIIQHTFDMLKAINGLLYVPGLDKVVENLTGPIKEIREKLKTIKDFNELLV